MLFRNIANIFAGNAFSSLLTYLSLLFASVHLPVIEYGHFTKFYYAIGITYFLFDMGLCSSLLIKIKSGDDLFSIKDFFLVNKYKYCVCIAITVVVGISFFDVETTTILIVVSISALINKLVCVNLQLVKRWRDSAKSTFVYTLIRALFIFLSIIVYQYVNLKTDAKSLEYAILYASLIAVFINIKQMSSLNEYRVIKLNEIVVDNMARYIYFGSLLAVVCMRADVFLIDYFVGSEEAGLYSKVSILFFAFPMLISSINTVLIRHYAVDVKLEHIISKNKFKLLLLCVSMFYMLACYFFYKILYIHYSIVTYELLIVLDILLFSYLGALFSSGFESSLLSKDQQYYAIIKLIQLCSLLIVFYMTYDVFGIVSGALAFCSSRISGWFMIYIYDRRTV